MANFMGRVSEISEANRQEMANRGYQRVVSLLLKGLTIEEVAKRTHYSTRHVARLKSQAVVNADLPEAIERIKRSARQSARQTVGSER